MTCVAVALSMAIVGADPWAPTPRMLVSAGASHGPATLGDQPWRLLTYGVVHLGALHLIGNLVPLLVLGTLLERRVGRAAMAVIYAVSTAAGGLVAAMWRPEVALAGASGALCGVAGALAVLTAADGATLPAAPRRLVVGAVVGFALLQVGFALTLDVTDQAAHLGGLIGGVAIACILVAGARRGRPIGGARIAGAALLGGGVIVLFAATTPAPRDPGAALPILRAAVDELRTADDRFAALVGSDDAPPADADALAAAIGRDVLPLIDDAAGQLATLPVPPALAARRDAYAAYAAARRRAIALFVDYLESRDPALLAPIQAASAEADVARDAAAR